MLKDFILLFIIMISNNKYEYFLNNIQNCKANCMQEEEQQQQQQNMTEELTGDTLTQQQNMTEELTGDTLTEFLQLLNEEDFSDAILDPKTIDLSFLRKKGDMVVDMRTWHN